MAKERPKPISAGGNLRNALFERSQKDSGEQPEGLGDGARRGTDAPCGASAELARSPESRTPRPMSMGGNLTNALFERSPKDSGE